MGAEERLRKGRRGERKMECLVVEEQEKGVVAGWGIDSRARWRLRDYSGSS